MNCQLLCAQNSGVHAMSEREGYNIDLTSRTPFGSTAPLTRSRYGELITSHEAIERLVLLGLNRISTRSYQN